MRKLLAIASLLTALILFSSCASIKQHHLRVQFRKEQKFSEDSLRRIIDAYRGDTLNSHYFYFNKANWITQGGYQGRLSRGFRASDDAMENGKHLIFLHRASGEIDIVVWE